MIDDYPIVLWINRQDLQNTASEVNEAVSFLG